MQFPNAIMQACRQRGADNSNDRPLVSIIIQ
jgi:hypothetical protein